MPSITSLLGRKKASISGGSAAPTKPSESATPALEPVAESQAPATPAAPQPAPSQVHSGGFVKLIPLGKNATKNDSDNKKTAPKEVEIGSGPGPKKEIQTLSGMELFKASGAPAAAPATPAAPTTSVPAKKQELEIADSDTGSSIEIERMEATQPSISTETATGAGAEITATPLEMPAPEKTITQMNPTDLSMKPVPAGLGEPTVRIDVPLEPAPEPLPGGSSPTPAPAPTGAPNEPSMGGFEAPEQTVIAPVKNRSGRRRPIPAKPLIRWDRLALERNSDPLGRGLFEILSAGADCSLFLVITPPPLGSPAPVFHATATVCDEMLKLPVWTGLKWDPVVVPEVWNHFIAAGVVELSPPGPDTTVTSSRNVVRSAFGLEKSEWLTLIRVGPAHRCRGLLAITSRASLMGHIQGALQLLWKDAAPRAA